jgi:transcriptional regulator with PAS, ATPase and Fis domain
MNGTERETLSETSWGSQGEGKPEPGLVVIFSGNAPLLRAIPFTQGRLVLGRADAGGVPLPDERVSREHAELTIEGGRVTVRDLDSRNGTFVNGQRVHGQASLGEVRVLRIGHTVCLLLRDVRRFDGSRVAAKDGVVAGPTFRAALERVARVAAGAGGLLITGESGTGKELAARAFHQASPHASGPFVAVNCAAIPEGVAERLLFGAKRGAYSGAQADAEGYVQAAHGGTLFLDEIGELELEVQAKLLRVLETREVLPLGASMPRRVDVRLVSATHRNLRLGVADGRFRADLYYRIGQPEVTLPPLRERPEEMPALIAAELGKLGGQLTPHAKLIESCVLRPWPGNVRELLSMTRRAADAATAEDSPVVRVENLDATAGMPFAEEGAGGLREPHVPTPEMTREGVEAALAAAGGNIAAAARALGLHRTQLYRVLKRLGIAAQRPVVAAGATPE